MWLEQQEALTEFVEIARSGEAFILHPGEFVLGSTTASRAVTYSRRIWLVGWRASRVSAVSG